MKYRRNTNKYRFLTSDTLPFELPVIFSNRLIAKYLKRIDFKYDIVSDEVLSFHWAKGNDVTFKVISILCGMSCFNTNPDRATLNKKIDALETIPLKYVINQGNGKKRTLSVAHPLNQLAMMAFFEKNKELVLYCCGKSPYSLRYPRKVATWRYIKDYSHYLSVISSDTKSSIEEFDFEYDNQKSFFRYEKYSNVYKFYESNYYHFLEKKYSHLMRIDISRCFENIYSHSISWAVFGKEYSKQYKNGIVFSSIFDLLMRQCNRDETNGIIIGPEFSRVFSEIILQRIDLDIEAKINHEKIEDLDVHISRYVDDYFVFYNLEFSAVLAEKIVGESLSRYGLFLNDAKKTVIDAPIITDLSIGKYDLRKVLDELTIQDDVLPFFDAEEFITVVKRIVRDNKLTYGDIQNYLLSGLEKKVTRIAEYIKRIAKSAKLTKDNPTNIDQLLFNLLKAVFFLISVCPTFNSVLIATRVIVAIINIINDIASRCSVWAECVNRTRLFDYVFSETKSIIFSHRKDKSFQIVNSYLLLVVSRLGSSYRISEDFILDCLCEPLTAINEKDFFDVSELYFLIMILRFYIVDDNRYKEVRKRLDDSTMDLLCKKMKRSTSTQVMLLIDSLACPYIPASKKHIFLRKAVVDGNSYNGNHKTAVNAVCDSIIKEIMSNEVSFINWKNFRLEEELDLKRGQFVY